MSKVIAFSPYQASLEFGAINHSSGINWSYAYFPDETSCKSFDKACNDNGYRTRNDHKTQTGMYAVQYHHYQD